MHFAFTDEQEQLRDAVRGLLTKECPPSKVREAWTNRSGRVPGLWKQLAELGVVGLMAPQSQGGLGLSEIDLLLILEETGRFAVPEPIVDTIAVGIPLLAEIGRSDLVTVSAEGGLTVALGLRGFPLIVGAHTADHLLLQDEHLDLHLIRHRRQATLQPEPSVDGSRRLFRVAWTPGNATLLARSADHSDSIVRALHRGFLATSAQLIGVARHLIDVTVDYVKVREQFQKPVGSFQAVKHHLANAQVKLEFARPVVYRAAWSLAKNDPLRSLHVSMAKSQASDAALLAARTALQCHGAIGYAYEHDLHLWMKRAWSLAAAWGDALWHRARIGAAILDRPQENSDG